MEHLLTFDNLMALTTLSVLEIVLGIDNIVVIAILSGKLPAEQQAKARQTGLTLAMLVRVCLLLLISVIMGLTAPIFAIAGHEVSGRDLILLAGGFFLVAKATHEIHDKLEGSHETIHKPKPAAKLGSIVFQIILFDIVFSIDSVITAIGMVQAKQGVPAWVPMTVMIAAIVIAISVMLIFSGGISRFIERHPTTKMLAMSFLLLIGVVLIADGFHQHVPRGYIYTAMAFSVFVEMINLKVRPSSPITAQPGSHAASSD